MKRLMNAAVARRGGAVLLALSMMWCAGCTKEETSPTSSEPLGESPASSSSAAPPAAPVDPADMRPPWTLSNFISVDLDNNEITQTIFAEHRLTMVVIWATTCDPCVASLPDLSKLAEEYRERGLGMVGIVADVSKKGKIPDAKALTEEMKVSFVNLLPTTELCAVPIGEKRLGDITTVPVTLFVDSSGNTMGEIYEGVKSKDTWEKIIGHRLDELEKA